MKKSLRTVSASALSVFLLCAAPAAFAVQDDAAPAAEAQEKSELVSFLDQAFEEQLALSPQSQTYLGRTTNYGQLDDYTAEADARALALAEQQLAEMRERFDPESLSESDRISFELFEDDVRRQRIGQEWRDHGFIFRANGGPTGSLPVFMINAHRVGSVEDAEAYVSRLREVERVGNEIAADFRTRAEAGVVPPAFVFEPTIADARAVITGAPFGEGEDTPLWADIKEKVAELDADEETQQRLLDEAKAALTGEFQAGYDAMIAALEEVQPMADSNDGVWRLPDGKAYYDARVALSTTTELTADEIHQIGLEQIDRLRGEMDAIRQEVGFEGTLNEFIQYVKTDESFNYPNTEAGREEYLEDARAYIDQMMEAAPDWFGRLPKAPLEVRAVEEWREATASVAFYNRATPDGSRPGIFYVNLADMTEVLKPQVEGIAYHEGAPGHHFQVSIAQEQDGLPMFRRFGGYGAYSEGWGLYSERLGKEMGFYEDPYSDFGRLGLEIWRAARLVTDTGLHAKEWSREEAIDYFKENTLVADLDIVKEVERYITNPGQATSYMIGQRKILDLREEARNELGDDFDIAQFHDTILSQGGLPLSVLEEQVRGWIAEEKAEGEGAE
ncbi:MAG: DUF885 domain-containing protein [Euryhalocaulis sp.]|uniref:DUF885 domain-containing protein n=1 Tax=Euryhalocaulis sp. TaxID=2744307 RepID=UPI0017C7ACD4|nr:DUF885 domain-containing protein [Euryhalocaulis sp.]MBA4800771.1 DUF885 domain-containing protein [Euryhalocaulis sp.]